MKISGKFSHLRRPKCLNNVMDRLGSSCLLYSFLEGFIEMPKILDVARPED